MPLDEEQNWGAGRAPGYSAFDFRPGCVGAVDPGFTGTTRYAGPQKGG
jgi:hypothetical protein